MTPRRILITGASRGLGAALAIRYATPNVELYLTARNHLALSKVSTDCESKGALVRCLQLDLSQPESIHQLLQHTFNTSLPDLVIANAGVFSGRRSDDSLEEWGEQSHQIAVNLTGQIQLLDGLAQRMKTRGSGHLVVISSLAAIQPQPDSPAYSASKAGLAAWGRAIGEDLSSFGVKVSVVYPGHIESDQTAVHAGMLPGLVSVDKAAGLVIRHIAKGRERIIFPYHIYCLVLMSNLLPAKIRRWANRPYRYHVKRPDDHPLDGAE